jgi:heat shock protein HtpX
LELLDRRELEGVLGHELGHVKNRDTLVSTVAATLAGALSMLADMAMWGSLFGNRDRDEGGGHPLAGLVGILLAPLAGALIQSTISRAREFGADHSGAEVTGDPLALASALEKIETWSKRVPITAGTPATAHLFIVNPFAGRHLLTLFNTHPPTAERVKRLEALAQRRMGIGI